MTGGKRYSVATVFKNARLKVETENLTPTELHTDKIIQNASSDTESSISSCSSPIMQPQTPVQIYSENDGLRYLAGYVERKKVLRFISLTLGCRYSRSLYYSIRTVVDDAYQHTNELNGNRPAVLRHGPPCFVIRHSELRQPYSIRTVNDMDVLTPSHFFIGRRLTALPDPDVIGIKSSVSRFNDFGNVQRALNKQGFSEHIGCALGHLTLKLLKNFACGAFILSASPNLNVTGRHCIARQILVTFMSSNNVSLKQYKSPQCLLPAMKIANCKAALTVSFEPFIADHLAQVLCIKIENTQKVRDLREDNLAKLKQHLITLNWGDIYQRNVDQAFNNFIELLTKAIDVTCPSETKKKRKKQLAEHFATYFATVATTKISQHFSGNISTACTTCEDIKDSFFISPITPNDITDAIKALKPTNSQGVDGLMLNKKTECIYFSRRGAAPDDLEINVKTSEQVKFLGTFNDNKLRWDHQINH
ncbi:hypothetical protein NQ317_018013, partial [Molorchus minor]